MPPCLSGAPVAQLDRASGFEPEGREFESLRARKLQKKFERASAQAVPSDLEQSLRGEGPSAAQRLGGGTLCGQVELPQHSFLHFRRHRSAARDQDQRRQIPGRVQEAGFVNRDRATNSATRAPTSCATTNSGTSMGRIPENVSDSERAIVIAGFAKDVDAVNQ